MTALFPGKVLGNTKYSKVEIKKKKKILRYLLFWNLIWLFYLDWIKTILQYIWASSQFQKGRSTNLAGCHIFSQFVEISVEIQMWEYKNTHASVHVWERERESVCEQEPLVYFELYNALNPWGRYSRLVRHWFKQFTSCWCIAEEESLHLYEVEMAESHSQRSKSMSVCLCTCTCVLMFLLNLVQLT